MNPVPRSMARGLWPILPLLVLSSVVSAQGATTLEFDSAVDSHRRLNEEGAPLPREADAGDVTERDEPRTVPGDVAGSAEQERGSKPAGERPMPVDPMEAMASDESEPEPSMPKASLGHDSVLSDYAPYEETDGPNWIEANERVGEVGGWREYAKELYEPVPAALDESDER